MTMDMPVPLRHSSYCDREKLQAVVSEYGLGHAEFNIEEFWQAVDHFEKAIGIRYVRMDFGVPGISAPEICLASHRTALHSSSISRSYPPFSGTTALREEVAEFVSKRISFKIRSNDVYVTCGGTQALFVAQAIAAKMMQNAKSVVFLAPVYPPMASQARFLGMEPLLIEIDGKRGNELISEIEIAFRRGDVAAICWASPNNPSWTVLEHEELREIAALCDRHQVIAIEDMTYLGMIDLLNPVMSKGMPSIACYTNKYFLVFSSSKMLSYAGERVGFLLGAPALLDQSVKNLKPSFGVESVRRACGSLIFNMTAGAPHSAQHAIADVLNAINTGEINLEAALSVYARRAKELKALLIQNGFYLIYEHNSPTSLDGFYVCFGYPGMTGIELVWELLYQGITVLPLSVFGSDRRDGVRACIGRTDEEQFNLVRDRLALFNRR